MKHLFFNARTIGAFVLFMVITAVWFLCYPQHSPVVVKWGDPTLATISTKGKTKVLKHDGFEFERLYEFCTQTLEFDCHQMKTPVGRIPFYMHKPGTDAYKSNVLAKDQQRDPDNIAAIMREMRPLEDPVFVDIGSNLGVFSMVIAKTLNIRVISVDPLIENVVRLCKTIQENKLTENMTIIFNALSDSHEMVGMNKPFHHLGGSTVIKLNNTYIGRPYSCVKPTSVMTCTLDDLIPLVMSKSAVLKVDVEAHEYKVLHGGQRFLDLIHVPAIHMEWVHVKSTPDGKPLVDFLRERNYIAYPALGKKGEQLDFDNYLRWPYDIIWKKRF